MRFTLDSSVIVASLLEGEKYHEACKKIMDDIFDAKHESIMPYSVLVETVGAIKRRTGSGELADKVKIDLENTAAIYFIELTKERANEAADIAKKTGLKGMDAIVVQAAIENTSILISLDNDMLKKSENLVRTMNIEEFSIASKEADDNKEED